MIALLVLNGAAASHIYIHNNYRRQFFSPILFALCDDIGSYQNARHNLFVVFCADDILLLAPSVIALRKLLCSCDQAF